MFAQRPTLQHASLAIALTFAFAAVAFERDALHAQSASAPVYILADKPETSIGGSDDRAEYQLQYPVGAARLSDGRIAIGDAGFYNVRYYDRAGHYLRTVGRNGAGPGEFRQIRSMSRMRGDTIVIWDGDQRRVSFFDAKGGLASSTTLSGWANFIRPYTSPPIFIGALYVINSAAIVAESWTERDPRNYEAAQVVQDTTPLVLFDRSGEHTRNLARFPSLAGYYFHHSSSGLRFGDRTLFAPATTFLWVAAARSGIIRRIALNGDTIGTFTVPTAQRRIRAADVPPPRNAAEADFIHAMPVPATMPALSAMRVAADDRLWVQKYHAPLDKTQEWLALSNDGKVLASMSIDGALKVLDIGSDYVIVLATDEDDLPIVQLRRLMRKN